MRRFLATALLALLASAPTATFSHNQPTEQKNAQTKTTTDAKVWVNTRSGVYHCPGTRWYGTTKNGFYMTETEAQQHGYRPAYGKVCGPAASSPASAPPPQQKPSEAQSEQAGKSQIKVWVNTGSGVYHCPGTRWYGNTKRGEYMIQKQAQDAGYRPAYGKVCR